MTQPPGDEDSCGRCPSTCCGSFVCKDKHHAPLSSLCCLFRYDACTDLDLLNSVLIEDVAGSEKSGSGAVGVAQPSAMFLEKEKE